jgi:frataxin-like iron-binding protein CyaY
MVLNPDKEIGFDFVEPNLHLMKENKIRFLINQRPGIRAIWVY